MHIAREVLVVTEVIDITYDTIEEDICDVVEGSEQVHLLLHDRRIDLAVVGVDIPQYTYPGVLRVPHVIHVFCVVRVTAGPRSVIGGRDQQRDVGSPTYRLRPQRAG